MQFDRCGCVQPHHAPNAAIAPRTGENDLQSPQQSSLCLQLAIDMSTLTNDPEGGAPTRAARS